MLFNRWARKERLECISPLSHLFVKGGRIALCEHLELDMKYDIVVKYFQIA
jgi:hypothetical protein